MSKTHEEVRQSILTEIDNRWQEVITIGNESVNWLSAVDAIVNSEKDPDLRIVAQGVVTLGILNYLTVIAESSTGRTILKSVVDGHHLSMLLTLGGPAMSVALGVPKSGK